MERRRVELGERSNNLIRSRGGTREERKKYEDIGRDEERRNKEERRTEYDGCSYEETMKRGWGTIDSSSSLLVPPLLIVPPLSSKFIHLSSLLVPFPVPSFSFSPPLLLVPLLLVHLPLLVPPILYLFLFLYYLVPPP